MLNIYFAIFNPILFYPSFILLLHYMSSSANSNSQILSILVIFALIILILMFFIISLLFQTYEFPPRNYLKKRISKPVLFNIFLAYYDFFILCAKLLLSIPFFFINYQNFIPTFLVIFTCVQGLRLV